MKPEGLLFVGLLASLFSNAATAQVATPAVQIVPRMGHVSSVVASFVSSDGSIVLSASFDNELKVWERASGRLIRTLNVGIPSKHLDCAALPDEKRIAFTVSGEEAAIWDLLSGNLVKRLLGFDPADKGTDCLVSPDGRWALAGADNTIVWDVASGDVSGRIPARPLSISDNGELVLTTQQDSSAMLRSLPSGRPIRNFPYPTGPVAGAISADNSLVAAAGSDQTVMVWRVQSGQVICSIPALNQNITGVSFSRDGRSILVGGGKNTITQWNLADGRLIRKLQYKPVDAGEDIDSEKVTFSRDYRWALTTGDDPKRKTSAVGNISSMEARRLAAPQSAAGPGPVLWDLTEWKRSQTFGGNVGDLSGVALSASGLLIAAAGEYKTAQLWETSTGRLQSVLNAPSAVLSVAISQNGATALTGGTEGTVILWDTAARRPLRIFSKGDVQVDASVDLSTNGRLAAAEYTDAVRPNFARLWDTTSGRELRRFKGDADKGGVSGFALTPDAQLALSMTQFSESELNIWDVGSGRVLRTANFGQGARIGSYAVSPDSRTAVVLVGKTADSTGIGPAADSDEMMFLDLGTGRTVRKISAQASKVAISRDGRRIATVGDLGLRLSLLDFRSGERLRSWRVNSRVVSVDFSSDGTRLVTGHQDGTIRTWNPDNNELLSSSQEFYGGDWITITPEGFFDASPGGAKLLSVVRGLDVYSIDQFKRWLYRPDLVREKLAGDPNGLVKAAAAKLDLDKAVASGQAPVVSLVAPPPSTGESSVTVTASVTDNGGGIGRVEWRINGTVLGLSRPTGGDLTQNLHKTLALARGENRIEVVAYNAQGYVASAAAQVTINSTRPAPTRPPRLYVLAAGVNDYQAKSLVHLQFARADASAVGDALRQGGRLYESVDVTTLFDQDVTAAKLDAAFRTLAAKITPDDVFVLFLAGHGLTTDGRFYYLPQDITGPADLATKAINQDQLQEWFVQISAQRAVLIVDACQSGSLTEDRAARSGIEQFTGVEHLNESIGRAVLSATTDDAPAAEGMGQHGVFTYALLEGLSEADSDKDGIVDIGELGRFVKAKVPELTGRYWGLLQVPQARLSGAKFPLVPVATQSLVAALPNTKVVVASATHTLSGPTVIRQASSGAAVEVAELDAGARVSVVTTRGAWDLIARDGKIIGYVEAQKLKAIDGPAPTVDPVAYVPGNLSSDPLSDYVTRDNRDPDATDLEMLRDMDMPSCASSCSKRSECQAFSYDKWNRTCFLKAAITALRLDPKSISGIRKSVTIPTAVSEPAKMFVYRNKSFPGNGFDTASAASSGACASSCEQSLSCVAYSYFKQTKLCRLFKTTEKYSESTSTDSGVKSQSK